MDENANDASRAIAQIIKLTETTKVTSLALGMAVTVNVLVIFYGMIRMLTRLFSDTATKIPAASDNKITKADTFVEIVRLNMTESSYTHFLDADNFVFV